MCLNVLLVYFTVFVISKLIFLLMLLIQIHRNLAYENVSKELSKWDPVVKKNRLVSILFSVAFVQDVTKYNQNLACNEIYNDTMTEKQACVSHSGDDKDFKV